MGIKTKVVPLKNYFIFTALNREIDEEIKPQKTLLFFIISIAVTGFFAGIRGMYHAAFNAMRNNPGEIIGDYPNLRFIPNDLSLNILRGLEFAVLEMTFFLILLLIFQYLQTNIPNGRSFIIHDVALVSQISVLKDILFLSYSLLYCLQPLPSIGTEYAWQSRWDFRLYYAKMIDLYDLGLYLIFILFIIIFFMPRVITRVKKSYPDYNKQVFIAFILSSVIFGVATLLLSIIKILIDLPLGFA